MVKRKTEAVVFRNEHGVMLAEIAGQQFTLEELAKMRDSARAAGLPLVDYLKRDTAQGTGSALVG